ncbi:type II toxin-antitoxin system prevent-host-death family antitoxin [Thalassospira tepidiphila]|uniref:type II toxin-antitoxin system prevent-host-death family antitoxin n=1 Tax=Thalassospira tepidiphila TaxID=393657 RepID=UPI002925A852|nr:hypothetical protein MACH01_37680 [Thalassospira tepidiphila]
MTNTKLTKQEVTRNFAMAEQAAEKGPVMITTNGKPTHVVLTYADYDRLVANTPKPSLATLFYFPGAADVSFCPEKIDTKPRPDPFE